MPRGTLIVFEGLDRAGKSTQCARLVSTLQQEGHKVRHMRFPNRTTTTGQQINAYLTSQNELSDQVIHLLFSANRWEAAAQIEADVAAGKTVVIDRYYYSGCVYSAAKCNPMLSLSWARAPEVGLPRPDVVIFLDISEEAAVARGGFGDERYEKSEMQKEVRRLFGMFRTVLPEKSDFVTVDGGRGLEEVGEEVLMSARKAMGRVEREKAELRRVEPWDHSIIRELEKVGL